MVGNPDPSGRQPPDIHPLFTDSPLINCAKTLRFSAQSADGARRSDRLSPGDLAP